MCFFPFWLRHICIDVVCSDKMMCLGLQQVVCCWKRVSDSQNWNRTFPRPAPAPLTTQAGSAQMPIMVKAYYGVNHENRMFPPLLCPNLGQLTEARAALDSQLYQHLANPSDSHMDHSGRWVVRGLQGEEGGCCEEIHQEAIEAMWTAELFLSPAEKLVKW